MNPTLPNIKIFIKFQIFTSFFTSFTFSLYLDSHERVSPV